MLKGVANKRYTAEFKKLVVETMMKEKMVPKDHLLRKIDAAIAFTRIYEFVEDLYCEDNGRPSVDPVVLFKIVLIQHIYTAILGTFRRSSDYSSPSDIP